MDSADSVREKSRTDNITIARGAAHYGLAENAKSRRKEGDYLS